MISYDDFDKIDMRVGKIMQVDDFPQARKPAYQLTIDFGPEIGLKRSSAQITNYSKEEPESYEPSLRRAQTVSISAAAPAHQVRWDPVVDSTAPP